MGYATESHQHTQVRHAQDRPGQDLSADGQPTKGTGSPEASTASNRTPEYRVLHDLGFFGHYLHEHAGGRSGKQHVLVKLNQHGGSMTQREMLERSGISSSALSEVLAKLEAEGLIERSRSKQDRRQLDIRLTDAGTRKAEELDRSRRAFEADCLSVLPQSEKILLVDMLDRVRNHWIDIEEGKAIRA